MKSYLAITLTLAGLLVSSVSMAAIKEVEFDIPNIDG